MSYEKGGIRTQTGVQKEECEDTVGHRAACRPRRDAWDGFSGRKEPALQHLPCETIHSCWSSRLLCSASSRLPRDTYKETAVR